MTKPSAAALETDPTSPFCQDVLRLFRGPLAEVRFPDLDRARLEGEAEALIVAQRELERLTRALDEAREGVREAAAALSASSARGLAYARVFAAGDAALEQAIGEVRGPGEDMELRPVAREPKAPRRRRAGRDQATAELDIASPVTAADASDERSRDVTPSAAA